MRLLDAPDPGFTSGCVLVPTMGALHAGHAALIARARSIADQRRARVVATVFVNPTQFNESTDFERYPRTLREDLALCERAGADAVFAPASHVVYPPDTTIPTPLLPKVATLPGLEDAHRPGHFAGVCQVVSRLFDLTSPGVGVFGEKDWQQLQVIRAMTIAQFRPIDIVPAETVREPDGLAMSSRNRLLDPESRERAAGIHRALARAAAQRSGPAEAERVLAESLADAGILPEYAVVRDARTLLPPKAAHDGPCRALVAARVGGVRLIDNVPWQPT
tara:strand:+ start:6428 stop:7258 length:831 start_codon:yes stop_codon:yes gene_type:complete